MIRDALLAAGLSFSVFTSLRLPGLPIGIGEVCLAGWLAFALLHTVTRPDAAVTGTFRRLLHFWMLVGAGLCLGTITAVVIGEVNSRALFIHDTIAYALVAAVSLLAVFDAISAQRLRRVAWLLVIFANGAILVQLAQAFGVVPAAGSQVWFYNRLIGWTNNPNQLSLLCLVLVFISLHLGQTASAIGPRLLALACSVIPFAAGLMTRSDSFVLAIIVAFAGWIGLAYAKMLVGGFGKSAMAALTMYSLPILVIAAVPLAIAVTGLRLEVVPAVAGEDSLQRDIGYRTELWAQALERIRASGFLGLGPGPHLVRTTSLREPQWDALPDFEAHNTIIDLGLQGGLIAIAALMWLAVRVLRDTLAARLGFMFLMAIGLCVFAQTHFVARHPIFWFAISFALATAEQARPPMRRTAAILQPFPR